ncbi:hypothetical protein P9F83_04150 [Peribacillus psychrosaccharolyticus]|uniref:hypothetical protein n=1 Tax=Peribacillus psychrosaccharolyticus TaxID=1407 RepID=UPI002DB924FB|nr:hypothetical protein [Peribacillus psychrosaccharolyticus]MEC2054431.1 hypothetical protein [Peribacillus psychrosaccharolyticus]
MNIITVERVLIVIDFLRILSTFFYTGPVKKVPAGYRHCPACDGTGNYDSFIDCATCDGQGYVDYKLFITLKL